MLNDLRDRFTTRGPDEPAQAQDAHPRRAKASQCSAFLSRRTPKRRIERSQAKLRPITTAAMLEAARLWAVARNAGLPTAPKEALDGDAILAAQALTLGLPPEEVVAATTNVGHLARFVDAREWSAVP